MIKAMMKVLAIWMVVLFMLAGCATQSPLEMAAENGVAATPNQAEVKACLQWVQEKEDKKMAKYDSLSSGDKAYALMHHDTMDMIKDVWGKNKNECQPGTNVWDAYIAWVEAENKTKQQLIAEGGATIRFASGVAGATYAVTELAAKVGDKIQGDKNTAGQNVNKAGEGLENSGSQSTTQTTVKQTQVAAADSSSSAQPSQSAVPAASPATTPETATATAAPAAVPAGTSATVPAP
jgi:hypothetical protein